MAEKNECIIIISHSNYRIKSAGVEKYITEISELLNSASIHSVHLFPVIEVNRLLKRNQFKKCNFIGVNINGVFKGIYDGNKLHLLLYRIQKKYNFQYSGIHLNHLHGWDLSVLQRELLLSDLPIKIIIHDYEMICSNLLSSDGYGAICRKNVTAPELEKCSQCKYATEI